MQFDELLLHPATKHSLMSLVADPPQSLLLVGLGGMGKRTLAESWARQVSDNLHIIEPDDKGSIGIETIRELYRRTRAKQSKRLVLIIDHAEAMSSEAQNAFLKLLEEPQAQVIFILTAPHSNELLPTILSRVQQVNVQPLSDATMQSFLQNQNKTPQEIAQIIFASEGRPAAAVLLTQESDALDTVRSQMRLAKQLLSAPVYDRLIAINSLAKNRSQCQEVLRAMLHMCERQLKTSDVEQIPHWNAMTQAIHDALDQLSRNGNLKIIMLKLLT